MNSNAEDTEEQFYFDKIVKLKSGNIRKIYSPTHKQQVFHLSYTQVMYQF